VSKILEDSSDKALEKLGVIQRNLKYALFGDIDALVNICRENRELSDLIKEALVENFFQENCQGCVKKEDCWEDCFSKLALFENKCLNYV